MDYFKSDTNDLLFLKECGMLTDERKEAIVQGIEYIFSIISSRSKKRSIPSINSDNRIEEGSQDNDAMNHNSVS